MRAKLKHQLQQALQNYLRAGVSKGSSPLSSAYAAAQSTAQQQQTGATLSDLLNTLREVHSFCYASVTKSGGGGGGSKKSKKKAAAIAAFAAGNTVDTAASINLDKISVANMPDLVQQVVRLELQHQALIGPPPSSPPLATLTTATTTTTTTKAQLAEMSRLSILTAAIDAVAGIRDVPDAEVGVKGFLVGIKQSIYRQMQHEAGGAPARDLDSFTPGEMAAWVGDDINTGGFGREIQQSMLGLLTALGSPCTDATARMHGKSVSTSTTAATATGSTTLPTFDMMLSLSLAESNKEVDFTADSDLTAVAMHARATFQMVKIFSYALELLPVLRQVRIMLYCSLLFLLVMPVCLSLINLLLPACIL
jgi:hypothetical protein